MSSADGPSSSESDPKGSTPENTLTAYAQGVCETQGCQNLTPGSDDANNSRCTQCLDHARYQDSTLPHPSGGEGDE